MLKATPGPWKYEHASGAIYYDDGDVEPLIASTNLESVSVEQGDADGHLIAAAPDLYEALKAVVGITDRKTDEFDKARAALAKARGEPA